MIKLFVTDCDGVLTNGAYCVSEEGLLSKGFYSRDFHGMWMLNNAGVSVGVMSYSRDPVVSCQCNRVATYAICMTGIKDKAVAVESRFVTSSVNPRGLVKDWEEIAYIGDDVIDIPLLEKVGLAACPIDADPVVRKCIEEHRDGFVSTKKGGEGCVREFVDYIRTLVEYKNV